MTHSSGIQLFIPLLCFLLTLSLATCHVALAQPDDELISALQNFDVVLADPETATFIPFAYNTMHFYLNTKQYPTPEDYFEIEFKPDDYNDRSYFFLKLYHNSLSTYPDCQLRSFAVSKDGANFQTIFENVSIDMPFDQFGPHALTEMGYQDEDFMSCPDVAANCFHFEIVCNVWIDASFQPSSTDEQPTLANTSSFTSDVKHKYAPFKTKKLSKPMSTSRHSQRTSSNGKDTQRFTTSALGDTIKTSVFQQSSFTLSVSTSLNTFGQSITYPDQRLSPIGLDISLDHVEFLPDSHEYIYKFFMRASHVSRFQLLLPVTPLFNSPSTQQSIYGERIVNADNDSGFMTLTAAKLVPIYRDDFVLRDANLYKYTSTVHFTPKITLDYDLDSEDTPQISVYHSQVFDVTVYTPDEGFHFILRSHGKLTAPFGYAGLNAQDESLFFDNRLSLINLEDIYQEQHDEAAIFTQMTKKLFSDEDEDISETLNYPSAGLSHQHAMTVTQVQNQGLFLGNLQNLPNMYCELQYFDALSADHDEPLPLTINMSGYDHINTDDWSVQPCIHLVPFDPEVTMDDSLDNKVHPDATKVMRFYTVDCPDYLHKFQTLFTDVREYGDVFIPVHPKIYVTPAAEFKLSSSTAGGQFKPLVTPDEDGRYPDNTYAAEVQLIIPKLKCTPAQYVSEEAKAEEQHIPLKVASTSTTTTTTDALTSPYDPYSVFDDCVRDSDDLSPKEVLDFPQFCDTDQGDIKIFYQLDYQGNDAYLRSRQNPSGMTQTQSEFAKHPYFHANYLQYQSGYYSTPSIFGYDMNMRLINYANVPKTFSITSTDVDQQPQSQPLQQQQQQGQKQQQSSASANMQSLVDPEVELDWSMKLEAALSLDIDFLQFVYGTDSTQPIETDDEYAPYELHIYSAVLNPAPEIHQHKVSNTDPTMKSQDYSSELPASCKCGYLTEASVISDMDFAHPYYYHEEDATYNWADYNPQDPPTDDPTYWEECKIRQLFRADSDNIEYDQDPYYNIAITIHPNLIRKNPWVLDGADFDPQLFREIFISCDIPSIVQKPVGNAAVDPKIYTEGQVFYRFPEVFTPPSLDNPLAGVYVTHQTQGDGIEAGYLSPSSIITWQPDPQESPQNIKPIGEVPTHKIMLDQGIIYSPEFAIILEQCIADGISSVNQQLQALDADYEPMDMDNVFARIVSYKHSFTEGIYQEQFGYVDPLYHSYIEPTPHGLFMSESMFENNTPLQSETSGVDFTSFFTNYRRQHLVTSIEYILMKSTGDSSTPFDFGSRYDLHDLTGFPDDEGTRSSFKTRLLTCLYTRIVPSFEIHNNDHSSAVNDMNTIQDSSQPSSQQPQPQAVPILDRSTIGRNMGYNNTAQIPSHAYQYFGNVYGLQTYHTLFTDYLPTIGVGVVFHYNYSTHYDYCLVEPRENIRCGALCHIACANFRLPFFSNQYPLSDDGGQNETTIMNENTYPPPQDMASIGDHTPVIYSITPAVVIPDSHLKFDNSDDSNVIRDSHTCQSDNDCWIPSDEPSHPYRGKCQHNNIDGKFYCVFDSNQLPYFLPVVTNMHYDTTIHCFQVGYVNDSLIYIKSECGRRSETRDCAQEDEPYTCYEPPQPQAETNSSLSLSDVPTEDKECYLDYTIACYNNYYNMYVPMEYCPNRPHLPGLERIEWLDPPVLDVFAENIPQNSQGKPPSSRRSWKPVFDATKRNAMKPRQVSPASATEDMLEGSLYQFAEQSYGYYINVSSICDAEGSDDPEPTDQCDKFPYNHGPGCTNFPSISNIELTSKDATRIDKVKSSPTTTTTTTGLTPLQGEPATSPVRYLLKEGNQVEVSWDYTGKPENNVYLYLYNGYDLDNEDANKSKDRIFMGFTPAMNGSYTFSMPSLPITFNNIIIVMLIGMPTTGHNIVTAQQNYVFTHDDEITELQPLPACQYYDEETGSIKTLCQNGGTCNTILNQCIGCNRGFTGQFCQTYFCEQSIEYTTVFPGCVREHYVSCKINGNDFNADLQPKSLAVLANDDSRGITPFNQPPSFFDMLADTRSTIGDGSVTPMTYPPGINSRCLCTDDWKGDNCQVHSTCGTCDNGGYYAFNVDTQRCATSCTCANKWTTRNCRTCSLSCNSLYDRGTANSDCSQCICRPGFYGDQCQCSYKHSEITFDTYPSKYQSVLTGDNQKLIDDYEVHFVYGPLSSEPLPTETNNYITALELRVEWQQFLNLLISELTSNIELESSRERVTIESIKLLDDGSLFIKVQVRGDCSIPTINNDPIDLAWDKLIDLVNDKDAAIYNHDEIVESVEGVKNITRLGVPVDDYNTAITPYGSYQHTMMMCMFTILSIVMMSMFM